MLNYLAQTQPLSKDVDSRDAGMGTPREVFFNIVIK